MKVIIPAAGLGTRLLPITRVLPKELLPVGTKPAIQWVLEEAIASGLREIVVVIGPHKELIRTYLTLNTNPLSRPKDEPQAQLASLLRDVEIQFISQAVPSGLGDAILLTVQTVGDGSWAMMLPDNVCLDAPPAMAKLIRAYKHYDGELIGVQTLEKGDVPNPDVCGREIASGIYQVTELARRRAKANLIGVGRYILSEQFVDDLWRARSTKVGEFSEVAGLEAAAGRGRLFGVVLSPATVHLGDWQGYHRAWRWFLRTQT